MYVNNAVNDVIVLFPCRTQAEEEKDKVQVRLTREQSATAELQAILEAEKNGDLNFYKLHTYSMCNVLYLRAHTET